MANSLPDKAFKALCSYIAKCNGVSDIKVFFDIDVRGTVCIIVGEYIRFQVRDDILSFTLHGIKYLDYVESYYSNKKPIPGTGLVEVCKVFDYKTVDLNIDRLKDGFFNPDKSVVSRKVTQDSIISKLKGGW